MEDKITLSESEKLYNELLKIAEIIEFNLEDGIDGREFIDVFFRLYEKSKTDKFYWQYCSTDVYIANYTKRKDDFIKNCDEATEADFCSEELGSIKDNYIEMNYPVIDVLDYYDPKFGTILKTTWVKGFVFNFKIFSDNQIPSMIPLSFFDNDKQLQILQKRKTEFLNERLISAKVEKITDYGEQKSPKILENNSKDTEPVNQHPRYFINGYHWQLFNEWPIGANKLTDYSFIYWVMWEDGFIHPDIKPSGFKTWIETTFSTGGLGKQLKQLDIAKTKYKFDLYASLIDKYKLHSKALQKHSTNTTKM